MKHLVKHEPMAFLDFYRRPQWCWVDVLQTEDWQTYIVFSEPENYACRSLTNCIENAINAYHHFADLNNWPEPSSGVRYIENSPDGDASWCFVDLFAASGGPNWRRLEDSLAWELFDLISGEERVWTV